LKNISSNAIEILDALKSVYDAKSDKALAAHLSVDPGFISRVRGGKRFFSRNKMLEIESTLKEHNIYITSKSSDLNSRSFVEDSKDDSILKYKVLSISAGVCDLCECNAPFKDSQGAPYLLVSYIIPPADGGTNTLDNLAALCPNCIAQLEVLENAEDTKKLKRSRKSHD
jgi:5-methylcytosine-specific restriction endonuclease McrA